MGRSGDLVRELVAGVRCIAALDPSFHTNDARAIEVLRLAKHVNLTATRSLQCRFELLSDPLLEGLNHEREFALQTAMIRAAMSKRPLFEILDDVDTPLGPFTLRRREMLSRRGVIVTEVNVGHELLMSSLNTVSEEALSTRAAAWHGGQQLRALVGGLGLGYTAQAALDTGAVAEVQVVEHVEAVIRWLREGLVPLSPSLMGDPRVALVHGDVYSQLLGPATEGWDLLLIDVDHSPSETLSPVSRPFYTVEGLRNVAEHLNPGGVLAVWSVSDDDAFAGALRAVFEEETRQHVTWVNGLVDGMEVSDVLFLARKHKQASPPPLSPGAPPHA